MINCIVIDDEKPAINVLKKMIALMPELNLVGVATTPMEGLRLIAQASPDLVFLDIQMGDFDGIELARMVEGKTKIIFCTAHVEYASQSYEVNAIDYLLKPIEFPRFKIAVQKLLDTLTGSITPVDAIQDDYILVKQGDKGKWLKIDIDDIVWIKALNNYVQFHGRELKAMAYITLRELETRLPAASFLRVHKSYIISLKHIRSVEGNIITMKPDEHPIPIGAMYKTLFMERILGRQI